MAIVAGFDVHRRQITFDASNTETGEVSRGRIDATPAADTTAAPNSTRPSAPSQMVAITADASGVVHVPLTKAGPWMMRSAYVTRRSGGAPNEFDVARATYTFSVGAQR